MLDIIALWPVEYIYKLGQKRAHNGLGGTPPPPLQHTRTLTPHHTTSMPLMGSSLSKPHHLEATSTSHMPLVHPNNEPPQMQVHLNAPCPAIVSRCSMEHDSSFPPGVTSVTQCKYHSSRESHPSSGHPSRTKPNNCMNSTCYSYTTRIIHSTSESTAS